MKDQYLLSLHQYGDQAISGGLNKHVRAILSTYMETSPYGMEIKLLAILKDYLYHYFSFMRSVDRLVQRRIADWQTSFLFKLRSI